MTLHEVWLLMSQLMFANVMVRFCQVKMVSAIVWTENLLSRENVFNSWIFILSLKFLTRVHEGICVPLQKKCFFPKHAQTIVSTMWCEMNQEGFCGSGSENKSKKRSSSLQEKLWGVQLKHTGMPRKAIGSGQSHQTSIKREAERHTAGQMDAYITERGRRGLRG